MRYNFPTKAGQRGNTKIFDNTTTRPYDEYLADFEKAEMVALKGSKSGD